MGFSKTAAACAFACSIFFTAPALAQNAWLEDWSSQKQGEIAALAADPATAAEAALFVTDASPRPVRPLTGAETRRSDATVKLYGELFGRNTPSGFLWSGVESGNPLTRDEGYRWDSLADQGLFDPARRAQLISQLQTLGVFNLRVGLSNHLIDLDRPDSWAAHDAMMADLSAAGVALSLDMHHFGVEDRFRAVDAAGAADPARSYYLHPDWPKYFARFSAAAYARYADRIKAVTLVNEPETTVGFNSQMWHGAWPGWGDPRHDAVYIERALAIAQGAVRARIAIEAEAARSGRRVFYMHTEAGVAAPSRPVFERFTRFLPSDLILGQPWLLSADPRRIASASVAQLTARWDASPAAGRTQLDWLVDRYVARAPQAEREARRDRLAAMLAELQRLHRALLKEHGKSMKTDTVFALDYYAHNQAAGPDGKWLSPEPQHYAAQVRSGARGGLYPLLVDYFNRYGMPMMIGESGTPFHHFGELWHEQQLMEAARAMAEGVPMLGHAIYPLVDTWGWETALSVARDETMLNPGGVLDLAYTPRPFFEALLRSLDSRTVAVEGEVTVQ